MKSEKGFTLIELLIAMVIIGFLIAGVAVLASNVQRNSRDTRRKQIAEGVYGSVQDFIGNYNKIPTSISINSSTEQITITDGTRNIITNYSPLPGQSPATLAVTPATIGPSSCVGQETNKAALTVCVDANGGTVRVQLETGGGGYTLK